MTLALWTILAAAVLPYLCTGAAKYGGAGYDNAEPRARPWRSFAAGARGPTGRSAITSRRSAHLPLACSTAQFVHAPQSWVDGLACAFIAIRLAYTAAYIGDRPTLRSALFGLGFACVIGLFVAGLH